MADVEINEEKFLQELDRELRKVVDEIFTKSQLNIVNNGTVNEGFLLKSGDVVKVSDAHYKIVYSAPYAEVIEFGSEPHMPPVKPIERWVRLKLGITNEQEARSIAWAIAKGIEKEGTRPQPFLRPALDSVR